MSLYENISIKSPNKSKSYLLPLLDQYVSIDYIPYLLNTYIYIEGIEEGPVLGLLYSFSPTISHTLEGDKGFIFYEESLIKSKFFLEKREVEDAVLYILKIPEELHYEYSCFIEGMYSYFREEQKRYIIKFLNKHYKEEKNSINRIIGVLNKAPFLRKQWEKYLAINISEDLELSSKIERDKETFNIVKSEV